MSLEELPPLDHLARPLRRLAGGRGAVFFCAVPHRQAGTGAERRLRTLLAELEGLDGRVQVHRTDLPARPVERQELWSRLNLRRDRLLGAERAVVIVILLEGDLPDLPAVAPDLWSVRSSVVAHSASPGSLPAPPALHLSGDLSPPSALVEHCRALSLVATELAGAPLLDAPDALYCPLHVRSAELQGPTPWEATRAALRFPLAILEGAPGAGKTTALQHLALELARAGQTVVLVHLGRLEPLPTLLNLDEAWQRLCRVCPWLEGTPRRAWLLLDGLNEVRGMGARRAVVDLARDLVGQGRAAAALFAGRPGALGPMLEPPTALRIQPWTDAEMESFLRAWVELVEPDVRGRAAALEQLQERVGLGRRGERLQVRELCRRPLFLAVAAALGAREAEGEEGEERLLNGFVEALLSGRREDTAGGRSAAQLRSLAEELAWRLHSSGRSAAPLQELVGGPLNPVELSALRVGTGLLLDDPVQVAFVHSALQDVLVARQLSARMGEGLVEELWEKDDGAWFPLQGRGRVTPVGRLYAERAAREEPERLLRLLLREAGPLSPDLMLARAHVAELLAEVWGPCPPAELEGLAARLRDYLYLINRRLELAPPQGERSAALLARLGDRRLGALDWVEVGQEGWCLARWPLSAELYGRFIADEGYHKPRWWTAEGWAWRRKDAASRPKDRPDRWGLPAWSGPGLPICGLSHHEARAYVRWHQQNMDVRVCLPPIRLFEAAAATAPLRLDWQKTRVDPPPLGAHVASASAEGVEDLTGLVRQWLEAEVPTSGGTSWGDPAQAAAATVQTRMNRRWTHTYGLRLARRP